eukprot:gb/GEZN01006313.1/.p1 GENE.gb/GEZN01006313.1/~~gb/GEZN01006313.1/.p1  ORF type:complete len:472 (+),score=86.04 gb/GEZN01006313.1/:111-1418(+)
MGLPEPDFVVNEEGEGLTPKPQEEPATAPKHHANSSVSAEAFANKDFMKLKDAGNNAWKLGAKEEATNMWAKAAALQPGEYSLHFNLAAGYIALKQYPKAKIHAWASLDKGTSTNSKYWSRYGWALVGLNDNTGAQTAFKTALVYDPENADAQKGVESVEASLKAEEVKAIPEKSRATSMAVSRQASASISPIGRRASLGSGRRASLKGEETPTEGSDDPEFIKLRDKGTELWKKKKMKKALEQWEQAVQRCPSEFKLHFNMAAGYISLREYEQAKASAWAALEGGTSTNPKFWARFGWALMGLKEDIEAGFAFDKALRFDVENQDALNGLQVLTKKKVDWAVATKPPWYSQQPNQSIGPGTAAKLPSLADVMGGGGGGGGLSSSGRTSARREGEDEDVNSHANHNVAYMLARTMNDSMKGMGDKSPGTLKRVLK